MTEKEMVAVIAEMTERGKRVKWWPLSRIVNKERVKGGMRVTLELDGPALYDNMLSGVYLGGFVLAERVEFRKVRDELGYGEDIDRLEDGGR